MIKASKPIVPDGHCYSPVIDIDEAERDQMRIWPEHPEIVGVDFNLPEHERLLAEVFPRYLAEYDYPDDEPADSNGRRYYHNNPQFGLLDPRSLFVMLRALRPRRMVEVGCGFSTLLTADVNQRFFGGSMDFTCIEPYLQPFLREGLPGITRIIPRRVQDVPIEEFNLQAGDILFIDSSHVAKTGSDVNYLYHEILPRLAPGVIIHIHDISFPYDYPKEWIFGGRSWNEQYLVQSMLTYTRAYRVLFSGSYAYHRLNASLARALGGQALGGCSLWLERTDPDDPALLLERVGTRQLLLVALRRIASRLRPARRAG